VDLRFLAGIGLALGLRQVALLLLLPLIALYAHELSGGTPGRAGIALGVYGLTQGALQIPFGILSDTAGRKRVVLAGTALLVIGLLVAAGARDVIWLIVGRAIQGSGAINGAAYAWVIDRTPPERLNRAMGMVAASVGLAAAASFMAGPLLYAVLSVPQIFLICAALVLFVGLYVAVAMSEGPARAARAGRPMSPEWWRNSMLWRFMAVGFLASHILMGVCFAAPLLLAESLGRDLWKALIPAVLVGIFGMRVATAAADRGHFGRAVSLSCLAFLVSVVCLLAGGSLAVTLGAALFMAGYLSLSALLPAGVSRVVGPEVRGRASGAYNTGAFLGSFVGAVVTGALWGMSPRLAIGALLVAWAPGQFLVLGASPASRATAREEASRARGIGG
jgi:MFS family permease